MVEGSEVTLYYDPMIAKVCAHGSDRAEAIDRLSAALDAFYIRGISHNAAFLTALLNHRRFRAGELSTDFIAAEFGERFEGVAPTAATPPGSSTSRWSRPTGTSPAPPAASSAASTWSRAARASGWRITCIRCGVSPAGRLVLWRHG